MTCRSGDLLNSRFRIKLLTELAKKQVASVFIGGPTPPPFDPRVPAWVAARQATEACIVYPVHMLEGVLQGKASSVEVIFLSSSAAQEEPEEHPFFWSATIRPTAETILQALVHQRSELGTTIAVWRPKVVDTELARKYGSSLPPCDKNDSLTNRLKRQFNVSLIPTPKEYVMRRMRCRDE